MTMGMTAAWSPALRRLIRRLKRHLAGFCRFINVIFGAALFRRVEPSVETVDVGRQVFDLLEHRRGCRSSVGVHDGEDARAERPEHAAATLKRRTSAAVSGTSDDDVDEDLAALETMRQLVAMCRQLDLLTEIVNDDGYNALQVG